QQAGRYRYRQPLQRILQVAELAHPFEVVAARQRDLPCHLTLRLEHGAPQVAPAYRELDGNVALLALPIDERGPRDQVHVGEVLERDLGGRAGGRIGGWNGDAPDGREIAAVLARVTHHDGEVPIAAG